MTGATSGAGNAHPFYITEFVRFRTMFVSGCFQHPMVQDWVEQLNQLRENTATPPDHNQTSTSRKDTT